MRSLEGGDIWSDASFDIVGSVVSSTVNSHGKKETKRAWLRLLPLNKMQAGFIAFLQDLTCLLVIKKITLKTCASFKGSRK